MKNIKIKEVLKIGNNIRIHFSLNDVLHHMIFDCSNKKPSCYFSSLTGRQKRIYESKLKKEILQHPSIRLNLIL